MSKFTRTLQHEECIQEVVLAVELGLRVKSL